MSSSSCWFVCYGAVSDLSVSGELGEVSDEDLMRICASAEQATQSGVYFQAHIDM